ncbi:conserved hypothetical protein [Sporisorium reilianum SRZ2]|uniref:Uncharacterized protein n=1 Tax=Sporisorium reilianum (strain SRZ2) TaxID=999809 RepID=E7A106_SPORE|nr:conserved hypothetical protein [Sporisorium reilianum SRZ2]
MTKLLPLFHVFGALVLWTAAAIHLLVHSLAVPSATITVVFTTLGGLLLVQELSSPSSPWHRSRAHLLSSFMGRALCFLLATAITFDQLTDVACDTQAGASPYSTSAAKFSVSAGDAARTMTNGQNLTRQKGPPVYGTAFYLCRSLAPQCVRVDAVPGQVAGSTAWVHVGVNATSRTMVLVVCAWTLAVSAVYSVLALMHRSGRGGSASTVRGRVGSGDDDDPVSLRSVEVRPARCDVKPGASSSSAYRVNMYSSARGCRCMPVDLYAEQLDQPATRCPSADIASSTTPSLRALRSTTIESALNAAQGAASTPDQVFRIDKLNASAPSLRAASDIAPRHSAKPFLDAHSLAPPRDRYGYDYGYDRTVDFASGCIMHYPLFAKKKPREQRAVPVETYATLLPPDFARESMGSAVGLAPRRVGKSRASVASKTTEPTRLDERHAPEGPRAVTTESAVQLSEAPNHLPERDANDEKLQSVVVDTSAALLSPSAVDRSPKKKPKPRTPRHTRKLGDAATRRLGTAESSRSVLSTLSTHAPSRPGTGTSTKSTGSFRLMRRRRGLFATLDLHLGSRWSGVSQDASAAGAARSSYDSQRSCSAGTFGDGVAGDASPLSTPRGFAGPPGSPALGSPSFLGVPNQTASKACVQ